jgi:leucyl-tRNA synthetase
MSKSRGNVVNPNDIVAEYGADTMRLYIMFIGDFEKAAPWSSKAVKGCRRFLDRVWNLAESCTDSLEYTPASERAVHKAIRKVAEDIEGMKFNTAIAALMALCNDFYANGASRGDMKALLLMLSPFAPHIAEELWETLGFQGLACRQNWPDYDESKTVENVIQMAVQVNGKLKGTVAVPLDSDEHTVVAAALAEPKVAKIAEEMELVKTILVKNKLINLILKPRG